MERETEMMEAWRPRCAAPPERFVICTLLSYTFVHVLQVCIRTTDYVRPNIFVSKNKQKARPEVRSRDGLGEHIFLCICANIQGTSLINGVDILTLVQKTNVFRRRL